MTINAEDYLYLSKLLTQIENQIKSLKSIQKHNIKIEDYTDVQVIDEKKAFEIVEKKVPSKLAVSFLDKKSIDVYFLTDNNATIPFKITKTLKINDNEELIKEIEKLSLEEIKRFLKVELQTKEKIRAISEDLSKKSSEKEIEDELKKVFGSDLIINDTTKTISKRLQKNQLVEYATDPGTNPKIKKLFTLAEDINKIENTSIKHLEFSNLLKSVNEILVHNKKHSKDELVSSTKSFKDFSLDETKDFYADVSTNDLLRYKINSSEIKKALLKKEVEFANASIEDSLTIYTPVINQRGAEQLFDSLEQMLSSSSSNTNLLEKGDFPLKIEESILNKIDETLFQKKTKDLDEIDPASFFEMH